MISDFLKAIQAFNALLLFEDTRIQRDFKNQLNRFSNLDVYNQSRLAEASVEFKNMYSYILKNGLENKFRKIELDFFKLKKVNYLSSLSELVKIMNKKFKTKKTRGGLNHWLIKLKQVYSEHVNDSLN